MSASAGLSPPGTRADWFPWLVVAIGLIAMYLPSYVTAWNGLWLTDEYSHIPLILAVVVWAFWQVQRSVRTAPYRPVIGVGFCAMFLGLLFYALGRGFGFASLEFGSQPLVVLSILLLMRGRAALRSAWFPVVFLVFMIPLPQSLMDHITGPLKGWISVIVVELLHGIGYPIARSGVMITVGPYQLLVADACSGLNSMFSLAALGSLYMYIVSRGSRLHNALMLTLILPIAFAANIVRVIVLVLVTYHLGDAAGQGFLHGAAGIILMLVALGLFFVLDAALSRVLARRAPAMTGSTQTS